MFYSPHKVDSKKRWAEFFTPAQWEALSNNYVEYYNFFSNRYPVQGHSDGSPHTDSLPTADTQSSKEEQSIPS